MSLTGYMAHLLSLVMIQQLVADEPSQSRLTASKWRLMVSDGVCTHLESSRRLVRPVTQNHINLPLTGAGSDSYCTNLTPQLPVFLTQFVYTIHCGPWFHRIEIGCLQWTRQLVSATLSSSGWTPSMNSPTCVVQPEFFGRNIFSRRVNSCRPQIHSSISIFKTCCHDLTNIVTDSSYHAKAD